MSWIELRDELYDYISNVIQAFPGWTINDVLETDNDKLIKIMTTKNKKKQKKQEVIPMHEFIKTV